MATKFDVSLEGGIHDDDGAGIEATDILSGWGRKDRTVTNIHVMDLIYNNSTGEKVNLIMYDTHLGCCSRQSVWLSFNPRVEPVTFTNSS